VGGVFLRRGDELVEMVEQRYELEDHLQELIERHPNLLGGDQVDPDAPRRWLVLSREAGLASQQDGADRWSVDHLLLDQDEYGPAGAATSDAEADPRCSVR
jgi:hypothetical protein